MTKVELKSSIHELIDAIENDNTLILLYEIISNIKKDKIGHYWNNLSDNDREELLAAEKESNNYNNLIKNSEVKEKLKKWL